MNTESIDEVVQPFNIVIIPHDNGEGLSPERLLR